MKNLLERTIRAKSGFASGCKTKASFGSFGRGLCALSVLSVAVAVLWLSCAVTVLCGSHCRSATHYALKYDEKGLNFCSLFSMLRHKVLVKQCSVIGL